MSPAQTSGLDSYRVALALPFFAIRRSLRVAQRTVMASKTAAAAAAAKAAKTRAKAPPPRKPAQKVAAKAAPKAAPAKVPPKTAAPGGKPAPAAGKAPVSNVEAIKAVAIKAAAKAAAPAPQAADKEAETTQDSPLLDLSDAAVRKMIKNAKKRGYVTYEQLNAVMPSEEVTSEKIEDVLAMLNEMGINVVENEDAGEEEEREEDDDEDDAGGDLVETSTKSVAETKKSEPGERTDDPVRMYLREMGSVELLSREGEIAIAKRIEAGREAMIAGLCESPLTFQAIIIWRDELNEGKVFLRDIIDLEATYAGPDARNNAAAMLAPPAAEGDAAAAESNGNGAAMPAANGGDVKAQAPAHVAPPAAPPSPTPFRAEPQTEEKDPGEAAAEADMDDDEFENQMSLAAIEAELKPKVVETFDKIADNYKKLRRLQEQDIANQLQSE